MFVGIWMKNWSVLSMNVNVTPEIITANQLPWDWRYISCNPNITIEFIKDNLDKRWLLEFISQNPMDGPYYKSDSYKRKLAHETTYAIHEELIKKTLHPSRHHANYLDTYDLATHTCAHLTVEQYNDEYRQ